MSMSKRLIVMCLWEMSKCCNIAKMINFAVGNLCRHIIHSWRMNAQEQTHINIGLKRQMHMDTYVCMYLHVRMYVR